MRKYFYTLLARYVSFYFKSNTKVIEFKPRNDLLKLNIQKRKAKLKEEFELDSISDVKKLKEVNCDTILCNGNFHYEQDIHVFLEKIHAICSSDTRLIICYYSALWRPFLRLSNFLRISKSGPEINWFSPSDLKNFAGLTDFDIVYEQQRILLPIYIPIISYVFNTYLAPLPIFRFFTLLNIAIFRAKEKKPFATARPTVSIVVAARNEEGNIENIVKRLPEMSGDDELILVEGNSTDNTWHEILNIKEKYSKTHVIKALQQKGKGKGDAVREGFNVAEKDILMILDADLTVPPEELPKFYKAITENRGEFINGSRLVYPMEEKAMRFFNILGNKIFALAFSFVLNQALKDTLCGTKVISRKNYIEIAKNRSYFGYFDPFGDFDLIFGAAKLGLKLVEVPIKYRARSYGSTNIQRWRHGIILFKMLLFAARKIKFL